MFIFTVISILKKIFIIGYSDIMFYCKVLFVSEIMSRIHVTYQVMLLRIQFYHTDLLIQLVPCPKIKLQNQF